jgi:type I restriction enzyme, S subunit
VSGRDGPWPIPDSWEWSTIGDVADVVGGGTPKTSNSENFEGGKITWITPADLSGYTEKYIAAGARYITEKGLRSSSAKLMPKGTVLFTSRAPIGYVAIAATEVATNQGFKSLVLRDKVDSEYCYYYMMRAKQLAVQLSSGTTFPEISGKNTAKISIPVPPPDVQRSIVMVIESYLSRLDNATANLKTVQAKLKQYRASVLKAAVEGRLVPTEAELARKEGRDYEPASVLLERILKERKRRWIEDSAEKGRAKAEEKAKKVGEPWTAEDDAKALESERAKAAKKYKEPVTPDTEGLPELPEGWCWATVDQLLVEPLSNGRSVPDGVGFPVLRLTSIKNGRIDYSEFKHGGWTAETGSQFQIRLSDFMVARGNGSIDLVGRGGIVDVRPGPMAFPDTMIRVRTNLEALQPAVLRYWWDSAGVRSQIVTKAKTTAGIHKVNQEDLRSIHLPLPPLLEQPRISSFVSQMDSVVENTARLVQRGMRQAEVLRQSILSAAFSGTLVKDEL